MTLGERIYKLRTEKKMSQGDLAEALEVSRQSISKWETNGSVPELDKLVKLSEIFEVSLDELVTGKKKAEKAEEEPMSSIPPAEPAKRSGYMICSIFMMLVLLCGTILLVINMYNGHYFEPNIHSMALFMICGSIIAFLGTTIIRIRRKIEKTQK